MTDEENVSKEELRRQNEKLLKKIKRSKADLSINRVPDKTLSTFKDFAHENFEGDYGMALKWLVDGIPSEQHIKLQEQINFLAERLSKLEEELFGSDEEDEQTQPKTMAARRKELVRDEK